MQFVERVHQTIGNIIHTFKIQQMDLDNENPWEGALSSTMFAIRSMVHNTTQYTPSQLVFGRDAILNINQEVNWQFIKQRKQANIAEDNLMYTTIGTKSYSKTRGKQNFIKTQI